MSSRRVSDPAQVRIFEFPSVASDGRPLVRGSSSGGPGVGTRSRKSPEEIEREAFQQGFSAGEKSGLEMAERKIEAALRRFAESIKEVARLRRRLVVETERDLVRLAVEIARKLVQREIHVDETVVLALVRVALEQLGSKEPVTLVVCPRDYEYLSGRLEELKEGAEGREVRLRADPGLNRGDCVVESEQGSVEARLTEQFKEVEKGLLDGF